ncbi:STAS domain-containing protein [Streptomyces sp. NPDC001904]|uniref:STAS domain-containing protein n=1 Tax=Streptomyces sp. NPDC001904 TaxID=3154531 RepID=UPI00332A169F
MDNSPRRPHAPESTEEPAIVTRTQRGGTATITLAGHLEWDTSGLVEQLREPAPVTIVDLSGLVWADSSLLSTLLHAQREVRREGRRLVLRGPLQPVVRRLFELTGTISYFTFT